MPKDDDIIQQALLTHKAQLAERIFREEAAQAPECRIRYLRLLLEEASEAVDIYLTQKAFKARKTIEVRSHAA